MSRRRTVLPPLVLETLGDVFKAFSSLSKFQGINVKDFCVFNQVIYLQLYLRGAIAAQLPMDYLQSLSLNFRVYDTDLDGFLSFEQFLEAQEATLGTLHAGHSELLDEMFVFLRQLCHDHQLEPPVKRGDTVLPAYPLPAAPQVTFASSVGGKSAPTSSAAANSANGSSAAASGAGASAKQQSERTESSSDSDSGSESGSSETGSESQSSSRQEQARRTGSPDVPKGTTGPRMNRMESRMLFEQVKQDLAKLEKKNEDTREKVLGASARNRAPTVDVPASVPQDKPDNAALLAMAVTPRGSQLQLASAAGSPEQQLQRALQVLNTGDTFRKHGRMGQPHKRFIALLDNRICWTMNKEEFVRYSRSPAGAMSSMRLQEIDKVTLGKQTEPFKRPTAKKVADLLCFSLIGKERTLDLEASSVKQCALWMDALMVVTKASKAMG